MVFVKRLFVVCQDVQRVAAPAIDGFCQLVWPVIIHFVVPAFFAIVLRLFDVCYVCALQRQGQTINDMVVESQNAREVLLQVAFAAVNIDPCCGVTIGNGTIIPIFLLIRNPRCHTDSFPNHGSVSATIGGVRLGIIVVDEGHVGAHIEFFRQLDVQVRTQVKLLAV